MAAAARSRAAGSAKPIRWALRLWNYWARAAGVELIGDRGPGLQLLAQLVQAQLELLHVGLVGLPLTAEVGRGAPLPHGARDLALQEPLEGVQLVRLLVVRTAPESGTRRRPRSACRQLHQTSIEPPLACTVRIVLRALCQARNHDRASASPFGNAISLTVKPASPLPPVPPASRRRPPSRRCSHPWADLLKSTASLLHTAALLPTGGQGRRHGRRRITDQASGAGWSSPGSSYASSPPP